jgi:hypothetical protein
MMVHKPGKEVMGHWFEGMRNYLRYLQNVERISLTVWGAAGVSLADTRRFLAGPKTRVSCLEIGRKYEL